MNRLQAWLDPIQPYKRYVYYALLGINTVGTAIQMGQIPVPPEYHNLPFWAAILSLFLSVFLGAFQGA